MLWLTLITYSDVVLSEEPFQEPGQEPDQAACGPVEKKNKQKKLTEIAYFDIKSINIFQTCICIYSCAKTGQARPSIQLCKNEDFILTCNWFEIKWRE